MNSQQEDEPVVPAKAAFRGFGVPLAGLGVILIGFITMRFMLPTHYGVTNWPAQHVAYLGQKLILKLSSDRTANARMKGVARELDGMTCDVTCLPDGGDFSPAFVDFMAKNITADESKKSSIVLRNKQGAVLYRPIPISFTAVREGDRISSYTGQGTVVLRPQEGAPEQWEVDWERKVVF